MKKIHQLVKAKCLPKALIWRVWWQDPGILSTVPGELCVYDVQYAEWASFLCMWSIHTAI